MTQKTLDGIKNRLHRYGRWIRHITNVLLASLAVMIVSQFLRGMGVFSGVFRIIGYMSSIALSATAIALVLVLLLIVIEFTFGTLEFGIFGWIGGKKNRKHNKRGSNKSR